MDWFAAGLAREGARASHPRAADVARRDVPTCGPGDAVGDVARRTRAAGWDLCVVVDDDGVVLGLLDGAALEGDARLPARDAMRPAPATWRPHLAVEELAASLRQRGREHVLVTTSDGRLVGLVRRADAERRAAALVEQREAASR